MTNLDYLANLTALNLLIKGTYNSKSFLEMFPKIDNELTIDCPCEESDNGSDCPFHEVEFSKVTVSALEGKGE